MNNKTPNSKMTDEDFDNWLGIYKSWLATNPPIKEVAKTSKKNTRKILSKASQWKA